MPKFKLNQEVWALCDNAPQRLFISGIHVKPREYLDNGVPTMTEDTYYDLNHNRLHAGDFISDVKPYSTAHEEDLYLSAEGLRGAMMNMLDNAKEQAENEDARRLQAAARRGG